MLRPYFEQGEPGDEFMKFHDQTDELKDEFETGEIKQFRVFDKLFHQYDRDLVPFVNRYRISCDKKLVEKFETPSEQDILEAGAELVMLTFKEKYGTFESFAEEYHGLTANEDGRYGYWSNPNAKWDWYQIGGRWSGHWPAKENAETDYGERSFLNEEEKISPNQVDIIRIKDIDFTRSYIKTAEKVQKFLSDYDSLFKTGVTPEEPSPFYGIRHTALSVGLLQCLDEPEITEAQRKTCRLDPWPENRWFKNDKGESIPRYDVIAPIPSDAEFVEFLNNHFNQLRTYAYLDEDEGWVEPGKMGWFGMSSATTDGRKEYDKSFMNWLKDGDPEEWVVCVDCHI
jgi:hypothetical protein